MNNQLLGAKDIFPCVVGWTYEAALALLSSSTITAFTKDGRYFTTLGDFREFVSRNPSVKLTEPGLELIGDSNDK